MNATGCHRGWMGSFLEAGRDRLEFGGRRGAREHSRMLRFFCVSNRKKFVRMLGRKDSCGKEGNSRAAKRGRGEGRREGMEMKSG